MIDNDKIAELRRLEAKATPGEWELVSGTGYHGPYIDSPIGRTICDFYVIKKDNSPKSFDAAEANAALIVAMRNALPEMLKALEDAEARKRELAECLAGASRTEVSDRVRSRIKSIFNPPHGGVDVG